MPVQPVCFETQVIHPVISAKFPGQVAKPIFCVQVARDMKRKVEFLYLSQEI